MTRMLCADGSISLMDLTYREAQRICKILKLPATGKHEDLEQRLYDYEEDKNIKLKVFVYTIVKPVEQPAYTSSTQYAYKILEVKP